MQSEVRGSVRAGVVTALVAVLASCGGTGKPSAPVVKAPRKVAYSCEQPLAGRVGVTRLGNKSGKTISIDGMDDIIMAEMSRSRCFQVMEQDKDKLKMMWEEIDMCAVPNEDTRHFDCSTFAADGQMLGLTHMMVGDVIYYEDKVSGAAVAAKFPNASVKAAKSYAAIALDLRIVEIATRKVTAATVVSAILPSEEAAFSASGAGANMEAVIKSTTPMGSALMEMLGVAVERLHSDLKTTPIPEITAPDPAATSGT